MCTNLLLTGPPGVGKTTCLTGLIDRLAKHETAQTQCFKLKGFYTQECRDVHTNKRCGFDVVTLNGKRSPLARICVNDAPRRRREEHRVGRYTVDLRSFEKAVLPLLNLSQKEYQSEMELDEKADGNSKVKPVTILLIDEIGKMELFSKRFATRIQTLLDDMSVLVVATVPIRGPHFVEQIKERSDAKLFTASVRNRDSLPEVLHREVSQIVQTLLEQEEQLRRQKRDINGCGDDTTDKRTRSSGNRHGHCSTTAKGGRGRTRHPDSHDPVARQPQQHQQQQLSKEIEKQQINKQKDEI